MPDDADDSPHRPWIRLDAAIFQDPDLIDMGFEAGVAFIAILTRAKLMGRRGGRLRERDIEPSVLLHHTNGSAEHRRIFEIGVARLFEARLLLRHETGVTVTHWSHYQSDPGGAKRTADWRERKASPTVTGAKAQAPVTSQAVAESRHETVVTKCDVGDGDGTGRRDVPSLSPSLPSPSPPRTPTLPLPQSDTAKIAAAVREGRICKPHGRPMPCSVCGLREHEPGTGSGRAKALEEMRASLGPRAVAANASETTNAGG